MTRSGKFSEICLPSIFYMKSEICYLQFGWPFNTWCPPKGHTYLKKPAAEVCLNMYDLLSTPGVKGLKFLEYLVTRVLI